MAKILVIFCLLFSIAIDGKTLKKRIKKRACASCGKSAKRNLQANFRNNIQTGSVKVENDFYLTFFRTGRSTRFSRNKGSSW